jgi:dihydroorotate dehydrogenase
MTVPADLGATIAGVRIAFCAMNAAGVHAAPEELQALSRSGAGAIVMKSATVHPFVHPGFRSLHNPGYDKLLPLVRELRGAGGKPLVASIAGATPEEYVFLARAFAEAGAALIEANLGDPWVESTLAPFESAKMLREAIAGMVAACPVPVSVRLPDRTLPYGPVGDALAAAGVRAVVIRNDFGGLEKFVLETRGAFDVLAAGGVRSGYDVSRALAKGARAVQVGSALAAEGPRIFARLEREMRIARGERPA